MTLEKHKPTEEDLIEFVYRFKIDKLFIEQEPVNEKEIIKEKSRKLYLKNPRFNAIIKTILSITHSIYENNKNR